MATAPRCSHTIDPSTRGAFALTERPLIPAVVAATCVALAFAYGPASRVLLRLQGYSIVVDQATKTVAVRRGGDTTATSFRAHNIGKAPVTIVGVHTNCGCISLAALPLTIPPGDERDLLFKIRTSRRAEGHRYTHEAQLYLDVASPPVFLRISVEVGDPSAAT